MTAHTPGPWTIGVADSGEASIDALAGPIRWYGLAEVIVRYDGRDLDSTGEANARLIAAAPDLLAALKVCAAVCAGEVMNKNGLIGALEQARAAIQKATGAQP